MYRYSVFLLPRTQILITYASAVFTAYHIFPSLHIRERSRAACNECDERIRVITHVAYPPTPLQDLMHALSITANVGVARYYRRQSYWPVSYIQVY